MSAEHAIPCPQAGVRDWMGLAVLALPTLLLGLDVTILYLAMPALAMDLRPDSTEALWIMDIYGFMIAGFLITMGTLGDNIGRRRLLMIGAIAFAAASMMAAYSNSATMLIVARALLGVAGATLMPSTLALISNMFADPRQRAQAIGIWATMFAAGMAAGPIVGGWVLSHFWWGAAFLVAVPVILVLLITAPLLLPEYHSKEKRQLDLASVALSLLTMLPIVYGIKEGAKNGPEFGTLAALVIGVLFGSVFVRRQRRLTHPLLDLSLFANNTLNAALVVLLFGLIGVAGTMLLVTQYLQLVADMSVFQAGLWMGPPALMMVLAGTTAPLVARRVRPGYVVAGALLLSIPGYGLLSIATSDASGIAMVVGGFSLIYFSLGTLAALGTDLVVGAAPVAKAGSASALSELVQELGVALGVALLGSLATLVYRNQMASETQIKDGLWSVVSAAQELSPQTLLDAKNAFVAGMNLTAASSALGVLVLALVAARLLRSVPASDNMASD
jgi:MFS transporter, DHA2 family, multidrug resistance protein